MNRDSKSLFTKSSSETVLFVGELAKSVTEAELERAFRKHGKLESCDLIQDPVTRVSRGFCFVKYFRHRDAVEAQLSLDKSKLNGK